MGYGVRSGSESLWSERPRNADRTLGVGKNNLPAIDEIQTRTLTAWLLNRLLLRARFRDHFERGFATIADVVPFAVGEIFFFDDPGATDCGDRIQL
jgi:hypothetical protein